MENTVKTIRLAVAYENKYGRLLWNKEWRIFTIEAEGEGEEFHENVKKFLQILNGEIEDFQQIAVSDLGNAQAREAFAKRFEIQLFLTDSDTHGVMNQGEWDSQKVVIRTAVERMRKDVVKEHPELIDIIPPEMRHRFQ